MINIKDITISKTAPIYEYLKKQQENRQFNKSVEIAATFTLISIFVFFAIKPAVTTISGLIGEIQAKEASSVQMRQKIDQIVAAQDAFSQIQEKYQLIEDILPTTPKYTDIAIQVEGIGYTSGVDLSAVNFSLEREHAQKEINTNLIPVSLNIGQNTSFQPALDLIDHLNRNRRAIRVNSVSFTANRSVDKKETTQAVLNFGAGLDIFYWLSANK